MKNDENYVWIFLLRKKKRSYNWVVLSSVQKLRCFIVQDRGVKLIECFKVRCLWFYVMVWRRTRRYGRSSVGQNPASGSLTSGISVSFSSWPISISSGMEDTVLVVVVELPAFDGGAQPVSPVLSEAAAASRKAFDLSFATAAVTDLFTKRPLTLSRRSARFFRQLYRIFLFHTRRVRLLWNLAMIAARSAGVYIPIRPCLLYTWGDMMQNSVRC